jgi:hypothetical protein
LSRYTLTGKKPRYRLVLGWDSTLLSFFAQVEDLAFESGGSVIDEEAIIGDSPKEGLLVWVGADQPVRDLDQIVAALAPYGTIPEDMLARLRRDREENRPLTRAHVPPTIIRAAGKRYRKHSGGNT